MNSRDLDEVNSDYTDMEYEHRSSRWMNVLVMVMFVGALVALSIYAFNMGNGAMTVEETPVIQADASPIKETPADPGGMQFPHQDKTVYETITNEKAGEKPVAERILPAPEEPVVPVKTAKAESWVNEKLNTDSKEAIVKSDNKPKVVKVISAKDEKAFTTVESKPLAEDVKKVKVINVQEEMKKLADAAPAAGGTMASEEEPSAPKAIMTPLSELPQVKPAKESEVVKPVEPVVAPVKEVVKTAARTGNVRVQLGAFKSDEEANANWKKIRTKFGALADKSPHIQRADLGAKGVFYRLQVGGFADAAAAKSFCAKLAAKGQGCFPAKGK